MNSKNYVVKCITNLHMGSGDVNFNFVDNEVERDPVSNAPSMYASGVKGALRSHFEAYMTEERVEDIFGSSIQKTRSGRTNALTPGALKFINGNLLLMPVRAAKGNEPYYMVTTKELLREWAMMYHTITGKEVVDGLDAAIEGLDKEKAYANFKHVMIKMELREFKENELRDVNAVIVDALKRIVDESVLQKLVIIPEKLAQRAYQHLPVMARNQLDNGVSKNLWYEEVVPHGSVFYFSVLDNGTETSAKALADFDDMITKEPLVQFGGHATVGDGLTQLSSY